MLGALSLESKLLYICGPALEPVLLDAFFLKIVKEFDGYGDYLLGVSTKYNKIYNNMELSTNRYELGQIKRVVKASGSLLWVPSSVFDNITKASSLTTSKALLHPEKLSFLILRATASILPANKRALFKAFEGMDILASDLPQVRLEGEPLLRYMHTRLKRATPFIARLSKYTGTPYTDLLFGLDILTGSNIYAESVDQCSTIIERLLKQDAEFADKYKDIQLALDDLASANGLPADIIGHFVATGRIMPK